MIINEDKWLYDTDTSWKDNIVTRFRKAALWMNMMITNASTAQMVSQPPNITDKNKDNETQ